MNCLLSLSSQQVCQRHKMENVFNSVKKFYKHRNDIEPSHAIQNLTQKGLNVRPDFSTFLTPIIVTWFLDGNHSDWGEMETQSSFNMHFSNS